MVLGSFSEHLYMKMVSVQAVNSLTKGNSGEGISRLPKTT